MTGTPEEVNISIAPDGRAIGLYHADYRTDFELGDDPFRYFRW